MLPRNRASRCDREKWELRLAKAGHPQHGYAPSRERDKTTIAKGEEQSSVANWLIATMAKNLEVDARNLTSWTWTSLGILDGDHKSVTPSKFFSAPNNVFAQ